MRLPCTPLPGALTLQTQQLWFGLDRNINHGCRPRLRLRRSMREVLRAPGARGMYFIPRKALHSTKGLHCVHQGAGRSKECSGCPAKFLPPSSSGCWRISQAVVWRWWGNPGHIPRGSLGKGTPLGGDLTLHSLLLKETFREAELALRCQYLHQSTGKAEALGWRKPRQSFGGFAPAGENPKLR